MIPVYITRTATFLPNAPIANDEIEGILGMVNGKPSKARSIVLRNNGIKTRHYAFGNGQSTHNNQQLAAQAVKSLFNEATPISSLELLAVGTSSPDQLLPSHAAMTHGELGIQPVEIISATGACCSGIQAMKYAFMSVACGMSRTAAACASEKVSSWMHASRYQSEAENLTRLEANPIIAFEKDFLRWMLSDGAGAALLQDAPNQSGISLRIDWIEITSFANELDSCMYAGAVKNEDGSLTGWNDLTPQQWTDDSVFTAKQDTRLLGDQVVTKGGEFLTKLIAKHGLSSDDIDFFLPHMSSEYFRNEVANNLAAIGFPIPSERWFYNLPRVGNVGSASAFLMLDELFRSGKLKAGQRILLMVPESARFSYAYVYLTVV